MLLLHLIAWGVVLAVGVAFIFANEQGVGSSNTDWEPSDRDNSFTSPTLSSIYNGWPIFCRWRKVEGITIETESNLHPIPLFFNVVVGLFIVAATFFVFVFPLWRKQKLFQVKLESLFILTATVAVLCAVYRMKESMSDYFLPVLLGSSVSRFVYMFPLSLQIPLGLGIGCTIFMGIWIALRLVSALVKILVKRRVATQSE